MVLVARVSPENAPPMTPMNDSSPAICVATGVALAGSPSVSKRSSSTVQSPPSHWSSASSAPSTDGTTMLALGPDSAPIAAILELQSPPLSPPSPALPPVSVVPQAASASPATADNATACHVLVERIIDPSTVLGKGLSTSAAS